jgi:HEAT repeat protein
VTGCLSLLEGKSCDDELILALGGPPAEWVRTGAPAGPDYWLRVWAARGLLYAWDDSARAGVLAALHDDAWRVREMALRVVSRHRLYEATPLLQGLREDPSARVRAGASRALRVLGT